MRRPVTPRARCGWAAAAVLLVLTAGCGDSSDAARSTAATAPAGRVDLGVVAITARIGRDRVESAGAVLDAGRGLIVTTAHGVWGAHSVKVSTGIAVLHGRMNGREKDRIMTAFRDREADILVSTSVIEVGIDVPNATVMLIEGADRFGLAQLHQFRGRVGRGGNRSYCLLLADETTPEAEARLEMMVETNDGFVLAEKDLELRGPGDFIGTRQSGLPEMQWLDGVFDTRLLDRARRAAEALLAGDPELTAPDHQRLHRRFVDFWERAAPEKAV